MRLHERSFYLALGLVLTLLLAADDPSYVATQLSH